MNEREYNEIDAIRFSRLKLCAISAHCYHVYPRAASSAMVLGRAAHAAILEPRSYDDRFVAQPEGMSGATKEGKAWRLEQRAYGREVLSASDGADVRAMAEAAHAHPVVARLLACASIERSYEWTDRATGLQCKARPDAVASGGAVLVDLKSARDVSERGFGRQAARLYYHAQLAYYAMGLERVHEALLVAVQSCSPYDVAVYRVTPAQLEAGERLCRRWLDLVSECTTSGGWPGVATGIADLDLPAYADEDDEPEWEAT